jgi:hypothetical protein
LIFLNTEDVMSSTALPMTQGKVIENDPVGTRVNVSKYAMDKWVNVMATLLLRLGKCLTTSRGNKRMPFILAGFHNMASPTCITNSLSYCVTADIEAGYRYL